MSVAVAGQSHPPDCYLLAEPRQLPVEVLVGNMDVLVHIQNSSYHSGVASIQGLLQGGCQGPAFAAIQEDRLHSGAE